MNSQFLVLADYEAFVNATMPPTNETQRRTPQRVSQHKRIQERFSEKVHCLY